MFQNSNHNVNNGSQSDDQLNNTRLGDIPLWKRIYLFCICSIGLNVIAVFVYLMLYNLPENQVSALANIICYSILFVAMFGVVLFDIPKFAYQFKDYKRYLYGFLFGLAVIGFDVSYTSFVNLFYDFHISGNEEAVRDVIYLYPAASVIILGIIGPICEEMAYRIGLFGLVRKWNIVAAFLISSFVFAGAHISFGSYFVDELVNFPMYLFSGFMFALTYYKFGFVGSMTAHITNNLIAVCSTIGGMIVLR